MVVATSSSGIMFLLFPCVHFRVRGILRIWSACALTAYGVVRDCQTFETPWFMKFESSDFTPHYGRKIQYFLRV